MDRFEYFVSAKSFFVIIVIVAVIYGVYWFKFLSPVFDKIEEDGRTELLEIRELQEHAVLAGRPRG